MAHFRTRSLQIEAVRWDGSDNPDGPAWFLAAIKAVRLWVSHYAYCTSEFPRLVIECDEGAQMLVSPGDWVVRHADGTLSACAANTFEALYEPA